MPARSSFDYATIRVLPRIDRGEFLNAAVVLFCPARAFLGCVVGWDEERMRALARHADWPSIRRHVEAVRAVCAGETEAGPIARLSASERFHWVVAPRSTVVQPSPVHAGLCEDPAATLDGLYRSLIQT